jgi:ribosomal protein S18 acetylase RimI-like enzyme
MDHRLPALVFGRDLPKYLDTDRKALMTESIEIRKFDETDLDELAEIYIRSFAGASQESWTHSSARKLVAYWLKRQPDLAFAADCDGVLAGGFIVGVKPWCDGNHLVEGELFVDPRFQRRGAAIELLRHTLRVAVQKYAPVEWETYTFRGDKFPLSWYRRIGFEEIEEWVMIRARTDRITRALAL